MPNVRIAQVFEGGKQKGATVVCSMLVSTKKKGA
jgi:hypothetical protein